MRVRLLGGLVIAAFLSIGTNAKAQPAGPGVRGPATAQGLRDRRNDLRERLKDMTPEQRAAARERAKERFDKLPADLQTWLKALRAEEKSIHDGVKDGTLDRKTAASQLKAWREANPRPKPASHNGSDL